MFAKDKEVARNQQGWGWDANNFNLGMDEGDIEELLAVVPEELSNEEMVEMEQEHIAVQEARGKETTGKAPQETPQENPQWRG